MGENEVRFGGIIHLGLINNIQVIDNSVPAERMTYDHVCHYHTFYELTMIYDGSVYFDINNTTEQHTAGSVHLMRPQDHHTMILTEPISYFIVQFKENFLDPTMVQLLGEINAPPVLHLDGERREKYLEELKMLSSLCALLGDDALQKETLLELRLRLQLFLLQILKDYRNCPQKNRSVDEKQIILHVMEYTRQHYRENISLADVADFVGISKNYLSSYFHDQMKITYWKYLSHFRLNTAMSMILSTAEPISQIAYLCGFNSYTTFSSRFRQRYGISPSECRRNRP